MFKKNKKQSEKDTYLITSPDKKHGKSILKKYNRHHRTNIEYSYCW